MKKFLISLLSSFVMYFGLSAVSQNRAFTLVNQLAANESPIKNVFTKNKDLAGNIKKDIEKSSKKNIFKKDKQISTKKFIAILSKHLNLNKNLTDQEKKSLESLLSEKKVREAMDHKKPAKGGDVAWSGLRLTVFILGLLTLRPTAY